MRPLTDDLGWLITTPDGRWEGQPGTEDFLRHYDEETGEWVGAGALQESLNTPGLMGKLRETGNTP